MSTIAASHSHTPAFYSWASIGFGRSCLAQVLLFLQWVQWLHGRVLEGKRALLVNLDETSVTLAMQDRRGNCVAALGAAVTHCDRTDVQPRLPQFIISSTKVLTQSLLRESVQVTRGASGWSTAALCLVLDTLADELAA